MRCEMERIWTELTAPLGLRIRFQEALASFRAFSDSNKNDKENSGPISKAVGVNDNKVSWTLDAEGLDELKEVCQIDLNTFY